MQRSGVQRFQAWRMQKGVPFAPFSVQFPIPLRTERPTEERLSFPESLPLLGIAVGRYVFRTTRSRL